jgi:putative flavoprotein involved in K+ transport
MTATDQPAPGAEEVAGTWLAAFTAALDERDPARLRSLFTAGSSWRDLLAFTWDITNFREPEGICTALLELAGDVAPKNFRLHTGTPPAITGRQGAQALTGIIHFETAVGPASGAISLVRGAAGPDWLAAGIMTKLEGFHAWPERSGASRPAGKQHGVVVGRVPWAEQRRREVEFEDYEPQVVIVGAGQAGVMLAARLTQLGVRTLAGTSTSSERTARCSACSAARRSPGCGSCSARCSSRGSTPRCWPCRSRRSKRASYPTPSISRPLRRS